MCFVSTKIEKEKRELAKQYGMVRNEVAGGEIAEELEKERRMFQLQMCEVRCYTCISPYAACILWSLLCSSFYFSDSHAVF